MPLPPPPVPPGMLRLPDGALVDASVVMPGSGLRYDYGAPFVHLELHSHRAAAMARATPVRLADFTTEDIFAELRARGFEIIHVAKDGRR